MSQALLDPELMRRIDRLRVMPGRPGRGVGPGLRPGPRQGGGVELADYRAYAPGDDPRQVDWKAYARLERYFLRLFVEEQAATLHLLIDCSASMAAGRPSKLDFARRLAAALGYAALAGLDEVLIGAFPVAPAGAGRALRGRGATAGLLATLAGLEAGGQADLEAAVRRHAAAARRPGPLLLIGDLWDARWREGASAALAAGYDLALIQVLAPEEREPSLAGLPTGALSLVDSETGERVEIELDGELLERYRIALAEREAEIDAWCRARRLPFAVLTSDRDPGEGVLGLLRQLGLLG
ncbi:MAG: DUF58 domain-containing protein [Caldilineae bacterium]|nr:DUF58 domain-containing protein [Caldilineae bacterium]